MKNYRFYAECENDTDDLAEIFKRHGVTGTLIHHPRMLDTKPPRVIPGWEMELITDAHIDSILKALEEVPDGHVMVRTLQELTPEQERIRHASTVW